MARVKLSAVKVPPTAQTIANPAAEAKQLPVAQASTAVTAAPAQPAQVTSAPVDTVAANPLNDRTDYSGVPDLKADIEARGQMSACSVVTREAFLAIYPPGRTDEVRGRTIEPAAEIGDSAYIVVGGSQRRLAVREIAKQRTSGVDDGPIPALKIDVQDHLAVDRGEFLAATTAENLKRKDPNPMETAWAIRRLSRELGSDMKAGEKLGLSGPVTSQRLSLFNLSDQLQALVEDGTIPYRIARQIAPQARKKNLTPEQQLAEWHRIQRADLTMVKSAEGPPPPEGTAEQPGPPRRSWRITAKQTPGEVAEILLERFEDQELKDLLQALETLRKSRGSTPAT